MVRIALWSLWAPALWLGVMALGDGSNLADPPSEQYFRDLLFYPVLSLFTAAAFVNLSLWLVWRRWPGFALMLWIFSVGISGLILFVVGLFMVSCEPNGYFSCSGSREITRFTLLVSGLMAAFTLPGWAALGISGLRRWHSTRTSSLI